MDGLETTLTVSFQACQNDRSDVDVYSEDCEQKPMHTWELRERKVQSGSRVRNVYILA